MKRKTIITEKLIKSNSDFLCPAEVRSPELKEGLPSPQQEILIKREKWRTRAKKYRLNNKDKLNKRNREYYWNNIDIRREKNREYHRLNKEKLKIKRLEYVSKNRALIVQLRKQQRIDNLKSWEIIIPEVSNCQICGKEIYFNKKNPNKAIHFDHKAKNIPIKQSPSKWLESHTYNIKNHKTWTSCNFGSLCRSCNSFFPSKNRKGMIKKIIKYILERR